MNITGFAKGLTQIGQYALARKQQDFKTKSMFALEQLKNEMWKRKLQQQTQQAEAQRKFLLEKYQADKQSEMVKTQSDLEKWNRQQDITEGRWKETKGLEKIRALSEQNRSRSELVRTEKEKDQTVAELTKIIESSIPKVVDGKTVAGTGDPKLHAAAIRALQQYGSKKLGFTTQQEPNAVNESTYPGMLGKINPWMQQGKQQTTKKESWKDYIQ